jgi:hypothetical protein
MKHPRQGSRDLGFRSFGSFGVGNRPLLKPAGSGTCRRPKNGRIHNYPIRRDAEEK